MVNGRGCPAGPRLLRAVRRGAGGWPLGGRRPDQRHPGAVQTIAVEMVHEEIVGDARVVVGQVDILDAGRWIALITDKWRRLRGATQVEIINGTINERIDFKCVTCRRIYPTKSGD